MTVSFRVQVIAVQVKEKVVKHGDDDIETLKEGRLTLSFNGDEAPVEEMVALINGERILLGLAASQRTLDEWAAESAFAIGGDTGVESITFSSGDQSVTLGKQPEGEPVPA